MLLPIAHSHLIEHLCESFACGVGFFYCRAPMVGYCVCDATLLDGGTFFRLRLPERLAARLGWLFTPSVTWYCILRLRVCAVTR